jgi:hypothetical protein
MQNEFSCSKTCICLDNNDLDTNKCSPNDKIECECNINQKCSNYLLCNNIESTELLDSHDGLCVYCFILNGKLDISENLNNQKCSFCLYVNKYGVEFKNKCDHHICVECYKTKFMFESQVPGEDKVTIFTNCSICPRGKFT